MTLNDLVEVLSILCADETLADLLNATLSAEADERLTDEQAGTADAFFEALCELRPDCMAIAQGSDPEPVFACHPCQDSASAREDAVKKISGYMVGKTYPSQDDLRAFVGMVETGEAIRKDFIKASGTILADAVERNKRSLVHSS